MPARHADYDHDMAGNVLTLGYPVSRWDRRASFDALNRADEVKHDNPRIADYDYLGVRKGVGSRYGTLTSPPGIEATLRSPQTPVPHLFRAHRLHA